MLDDMILIDENTLSPIQLKEIFDIHMWLAAPILSTHTNCLFYPNFGGTEYNLEYKPEWKNAWSKIQFLEGSEHFELLKKRSDVDYNDNLKWVEGSLKRLQ